MQKRKHVLLLSDLFFSEVYKQISLTRESVIEEFNRMNAKVLLANKMPDEKLILKINRECKLHFSDSTHVAYAYENKADFIVSWDKDFLKSKAFVKCRSPKDFLNVL